MNESYRSNTYAAEKYRPQVFFTNHKPRNVLSDYYMYSLGVHLTRLLNINERLNRKEL